MRVELATKVNPLGLHMGEGVIVKRRSYIDYDEDKNKRLFKCADKDEMAYVIGSVKRAVGKYIDGKQWGGVFGEPDYEPARLEVSGYVRLYECRASFAGKPFFVHPNDIKMIEAV